MTLHGSRSNVDEPVADLGLVLAVQSLNSLLCVLHVHELDDGLQVLLAGQLEHLVALLLVANVSDTQFGTVGSEGLEHGFDGVIGHGLDKKKKRSNSGEQKEIGLSKAETHTTLAIMPSTLRRDT